MSQEFRSKFIWDESREEVHGIPPYFSRSGNPGYIIGKPVIMGRAVQQESLGPSKTEHEQEPTDKPKIGTRKHRRILLSSGENWMSVLSPGVCRAVRKPVLFGMDVNVMCTVDVTKFKSCQSLQLQIGKLLLGVSPATFTER
jgi:hypothetical protein